MNRRGFLQKLIALGVREGGAHYVRSSAENISCTLHTTLQ